jgi:glycosyltransferase involved in cell wall biosynthesis
MKLLYLADIRFPMERANGIQTVETAHALARRGVEVELVVRRSDGRSDEACLDFFGLPPHPGLRLKRVPTPFGRFSYLTTALPLSRGSADVLYTRDLVLADLAIRFGRAPVVFEAHTVASVFAEERGRMYEGEPPPSPAKRARLDARERRVCRGASGVVTITAALASALSERHGGIAPHAVIRDGCRLGPPPPWPTTGRGAKPRVYYVGQLYPWKGVDVLVEAIRLVPAAELVVVGGLPPEPDLERVKRLVSSLSLGDRVHFRGFVPPSELAAEVAQAHLFVIPLLDSTTARLFTSPLKLFEAMASGRPVVASDLPSIREVLAHEKNALLVPPGDSQALAGAIERLLTEPALGRALAAKALDHVTAFSWDARAAKIESFLSGVSGLGRYHSA